MLVIVLLAGVAPFTSLTSSHECGMACCVGKPSHLAGSCSTALGADEEAEPPSDPDIQHSEHGHTTHAEAAASRTTVPGKHLHSAKTYSARHSKGGTTPQRMAVVASRAMTTPCSQECAAAATASTQLRRPREHGNSAALLSLPFSKASSLAGCHAVPPPESAGDIRLAPPRGPPALLINLSA